MTLIEICDFIGYKYNYDSEWNVFFDRRGGIMSEKDIIFSPLFIKKFEQKYGDIKAGTLLREHLDDPVSYLSNLLRRCR